MGDLLDSLHSKNQISAFSFSFSISLHVLLCSKFLQLYFSLYNIYIHINLFFLFLFFFLQLSPALDTGHHCCLQLALKLQECGLAKRESLDIMGLCEASFLRKICPVIFISSSSHLIFSSHLLLIFIRLCTFTHSCSPPAATAPSPTSLSAAFSEHQ